MNAREFQKLAARLAAAGGAAKCRAAISRSHYAVWLSAIDILEQLGFRVSKGAAGHGEMRHRLHNSGENEMVQIASHLDDFHGLIIRADNRLHVQVVERKGEASKAAMLAEELVSELKSVLVEPKRSAVVEAIQSGERK